MLKWAALGIAAIGLALWAAAGHAEPDPAVAVGNEWQAMNLAQQHVAEAVQKLLQAREADATKADERLKWVLDNWVPKPAPDPGK